MKRVRPNVYKRDIQQPVWKEWAAWLTVAVIVGSLRYVYYWVTGA
jgi:hypothetical protein